MYGTGTILCLSPNIVAPYYTVCPPGWTGDEVKGCFLFSELMSQGAVNKSEREPIPERPTNNDPIRSACAYRH